MKKEMPGTLMELEKEQAFLSDFIEHSCSILGETLLEENTDDDLIARLEQITNKADAALNRLTDIKKQIAKMQKKRGD